MRYQHKITIQKPGSSQDNYGHPTKETWTDVATDIWANVRPITGRERWASDHVANTSQLAIKIQYREGIGPEMRVVYNSRTYEITGPPIEASERRRELVMTCKEVAI